VVPQLRDLEHRFSDALVVIGVHSAKYTTEGQDRHLAEAVRRLEIDHPVVNDQGMQLWQAYAVRAWPTLMFLAPDGKVIGKHEGEFDPEQMVSVVADMIQEYEDEGLLNREPLSIFTTPEPQTTALAYPYGVRADEANGLLYIADTGHHRIVVTDFEGHIQQIIGSGEAGFADGAYDEARFHRPHGLWVEDGSLYVADTENHSIRRVDLVGRTVSTMAGTGMAATSYGSGGPALETALRSPWDVVVKDGVLYIAMAGNHQLWYHRLGSDDVRRFAGTGHEGKRDAAIPMAWLAQPSGMDAYDDKLVFADAETSSIRTSGLLDSDGDVVTLAGQDLFDWGDEDGDLTRALLQHAIGVAYDAKRNVIYVADTYNDKIKRLDPHADRIETLADSDFFEPHGLDVAGDSLYVADTNNHAIRRIDLGTGEVSTLEVE
jgi:DNA-binding beta-propeller fold protein YncE